MMPQGGCPQLRRQDKDNQQNRKGQLPRKMSRFPACCKGNLTCPA